jgi:hypothetical protein
MAAYISKTSKRKKSKITEIQTNSVLNDIVIKAGVVSEEPVVKIDLKRFLDDAFGFIKVGGDFG